MRMGSERIVEAIDVSKKALFQLVERLIRTSVGFFLLKIFEEACGIEDIQGNQGIKTHKGNCVCYNIF